VNVGTPPPPIELTSLEIAQIEQALNAVAPFGEVRLIVKKGRLRFIETLSSAVIRREPGPHPTDNED